MSVILEGKNVRMYFGGLKAVDDVDMQVREGEIFGIIGPNGAGKTTYFNVCSGVLPPTGGEVWLKGEKISGLKPEQIARKGMARTFQNIQLFKYMTVRENIKIGFHIHTGTTIADALLHTKRYKTDEAHVENRVQSVLEKVGLISYAEVLAGNLSYGIQRRVEIARVLALDPDIILLDEPAAGMNAKETQNLLQFIKELNAEKYTIVVIEHDMRFIMNLCSRIMVLNFGKKICEGDRDEVKNNGDVHTAYFGKGITFDFTPGGETSRAGS